MEPTHGAHMLGRLLLITGLLIAGLGLVLMLAPRLPLLGRLPGDLELGRGNVRVYLPITTSLLLSALLSGIFYFLSKFRR